MVVSDQGMCSFKTKKSLYGAVVFLPAHVFFTRNDQPTPLGEREGYFAGATSGSASATLHKPKFQGYAGNFAYFV